jgi:hypothetical protein
MSKIERLEVKEAMEEGRNWQGQPSDEERHKNNCLVSIHFLARSAKSITLWKEEHRPRRGEEDQF